MNKLFPIVLALLFLISSCSYIETESEFSGSVERISELEKQIIKIEKICNKECENNEKYLDEWCDCMHFCLNTDEKWDMSFKSDEWMKLKNDFTTTTINNDSVNITLNECSSDSKPNNE